MDKGVRGRGLDDGEMSKTFWGALERAVGLRNAVEFGNRGFAE